MNCGLLKDSQLAFLLPKGIKDSLICYTLGNPAVGDESPDIITCHRNRYLYEIKDKKIIRSLNLNQTASSVSCYYLVENKKIVLFYLVVTTSSKLKIIRRYNRYLKVVKDYDQVKHIEVNDFGSLGFPQIKITFENGSKSLVCQFPIENDDEVYNFEKSGVKTDFLADSLQILNMHIDDLMEEYSQLRKICFCNGATDFERIVVDSVKFSLPFNEVVEQKLTVFNKWLKVFGNTLILGMKVCNTGNESTHDMEITINHKKIKDYAYRFFQPSNDFSDYLFSTQAIKPSVEPGEQINAVVSFQMPAFFAESELSVACYVTCSDFPQCLLKETFEVNIQDVVSNTTDKLENQFTVEDLMAIRATKVEHRLKISSDDLIYGSMESILGVKLGFKRIRPVKDNLFYCTSTYLNEVFVAFKHITVNPSVWKLLIFLSEQNQLYFLVNALYDLMPENATILCDEN